MVQVLDKGEVKMEEPYFTFEDYEQYDNELADWEEEKIRYYEENDYDPLHEES